MTKVNFKVRSHGVILNIKDSRKDYLNNVDNLHYVHGVPRQCCEYIVNAWKDTNLLFLYPVAYLEKQHVLPDLAVTNWMKFLKETPFPIKYEGRISKDCIPAVTHKALVDHISFYNPSDVVKKLNLNEYYAFTIDRSIVLPNQGKYALACFSMIRNLFVDDYAGYVQKCLELKSSAQNANNFHIAQLAFLNYTNKDKYCCGSYNLLYVNSSSNADGEWYWTLTDSDTFVKNITLKSGMSINYCFLKSYIENINKNDMINWRTKDYHDKPLKRVILSAIKKNDFQTAFNNVIKYEET